MKLLPGPTPRLGIAEQELWPDVESALARLCNRLGQQGALVYISSYDDYNELNLAVDTSHQGASRALSFRSFEEFSSLCEDGPIFLPSTRHLNWLDPKSLFKTEHAILFARRTSVKRLLAIIFLPINRQVSPTSLKTISEFVEGPLAVYVDNALFGIELDTLMVETSHLLGRAIGQVRLGSIAIEESMDDLVNDRPVDEIYLKAAQQAVTNGLLRLELVQSNLAAFSLQRRASDETEATDKLYQTFDVAATIHGLMSLFNSQANSHDSRVTRVTLKASNVCVHGPESLLRHTFLNLYDNAVKFSYAHTFIDIELSVGAGECIILFKNVGVGVAPDEFKTIFRRLQRSRFKDPIRSPEGLGLGLAYCRRVVEDIFHGTITLTSSPLDAPSSSRFEGDNWQTTVIIKLPLSSTSTEVEGEP